MAPSASGSERRQQRATDPQVLSSMLSSRRSFVAGARRCRRCLLGRARGQPRPASIAGYPLVWRMVSRCPDRPTRPLLGPRRSRQGARDSRVAGGSSRKRLGAQHPAKRRRAVERRVDRRIASVHPGDCPHCKTNAKPPIKALQEACLDLIERIADGADPRVQVDARVSCSSITGPWALTWMDALVDGWAVTPRQGYAVDLNALWLSGLGTALRWAKKLRPEFIEEVERNGEETVRSFRRKVLASRSGLLDRHPRWTQPRRTAATQPTLGARTARHTDRQSPQEAGACSGARQAPHAGWAAHAFSGRPGVPRVLPWGTGRPGPGVSSGHGLAVASRALRRCGGIDRRPRRGQRRR